MSSWLHNPGEPHGTPTGKTPTDQSVMDGGCRLAGTRMLPPMIRLSFPDSDWDDLSPDFAEAHPGTFFNPGDDAEEWIAKFKEPRLLRNRIPPHSNSDDWLIGYWTDDNPPVGYHFSLAWLDLGPPYVNRWIVWYGDDRILNIDPDSLAITLIPAITWLNHSPQLLFEDDGWYTWTINLQYEYLFFTDRPLGRALHTQPLWDDHAFWTADNQDILGGQS